MNGGRCGPRRAAKVQRNRTILFWYFLGLLSLLLDKSNITVLAFPSRYHRSLRDYVRDSDVEAGRIFLVTLSPGLPGMSAYPGVTRVVDLNLFRTHSAQ